MRLTVVLVDGHLQTFEHASDPMRDDLAHTKGKLPVVTTKQFVAVIPNKLCPVVLLLGMIKCHVPKVLRALVALFAFVFIVLLPAAVPGSAADVAVREVVPAKQS